MRLQGPPGFTGRMSIGGMELTASDGQVEVPTHIGHQLLAHHGFTHAKPIEIQTSAAQEPPHHVHAGPKTSEPKQPAEMSVEELVAALTSLGIEVSPESTQEEMRALLEEKLTDPS